MPFPTRVPIKSGPYLRIRIWRWLLCDLLGWHVWHNAPLDPALREAAWALPPKEQRLHCWRCDTATLTYRNPWPPPPPPPPREDRPPPRVD